MKTFGKTTKASNTSTVKTEVTEKMGAQAMNKNAMEEYAEKLEEKVEKINEEPKKVEPSESAMDQLKGIIKKFKQDGMANDEIVDLVRMITKEVII